MKKAEEYYNAFVTSSNVVSEFSIPAEHSMVKTLPKIYAVHDDDVMMILFCS